jgi:signal transduction histidine kinase
VRVLGHPTELSRARDLVAFRVLQEALTNVMKHAGSSRAKVSVRYLPTSVEIAVVDDGPGASGASSGTTAGNGGGSGNGLMGMRERLALFGGTLRAGPRPRGGFEVRAAIPRDEAAPWR